MDAALNCVETYCSVFIGGSRTYSGFTIYYVASVSGVWFNNDPITGTFQTEATLDPGANW
jgi:hypothetical protein